MILGFLGVSKEALTPHFLKKMWSASPRFIDRSRILSLLGYSGNLGPGITKTSLVVYHGYP